MKIIVLNGSPKSETSFTMHYIRFIQKKFLQHELKIINVSQKIKLIEKDKSVFQEILNEVKSSKGVIWAFPVHFFLVPSQYKKFIELIFERKEEINFKDKYTAALSTSIHFFDNTAHNYMNAICDDLNMKYVGFFSADMHDLRKEIEKEKLLIFAGGFFESIKKSIPTKKNYVPVIHQRFDYSPRITGHYVDTMGKKIIVLTDHESVKTNISKMIETFTKSFRTEIEVANINDVNILGGCLGCVHCGPDNICRYQGKDEYIGFYNSKLRTADIIIFAGTIKDRFLSSRWKTFFDRSFFHTHIPSIPGRQIGFIISGPLRQMPDIKQIFQAYAEWQQTNLVDFITDEVENSIELDTLLQNFAQRIIWFADKSYVKPNTFLGVGGMKIFRDDTWGRFRYILQANHKFFKKHGIYNFPQKDFKMRIINAVMMLLTRIPVYRRKFSKNIEKDALRTVKKALEKTSEQKISFFAQR